MLREDFFIDLQEKINKSNENEYLGEDKPINKIKPLVSVTVQTYQHADYIEECLQGILMQKTDFPYEIIIGEDESTDGTREICKEYAERHPDKIRLFLRSRQDVFYIAGTPTGKFNGFSNKKAAKGKYIAICEGDDYWTDPLKLQKQVDYMENDTDCTLCIHAAVKTDKYGNKIGEVRPEISDRVIIFKDVISKKAKKGATATFVYLKSLTDDPPDWYLRAPTGDIALFLLCAYHGHIKYIDEYMSARRKGAAYSWSSFKRGNTKMQLHRDLLFLKMYNGLSLYVNDSFEKDIMKRKLTYLKAVLKNISARDFKIIPFFFSCINMFPLKERLLVYCYIPYIPLKSFLNKVIAKY